MANVKRAPKKKQADQKANPVAGRPHMPKDYGIPKDKKQLLAWSHVTERMTEARQYWICTVGPDNRPHATPVDGLWFENRLYFGGSPQTRRHRNLAANPAVCVHLESGTEVVILHGEAQEFRSPERSLTIRLAEAHAKKYGYGFKPEDFESSGVLVFQPRVALAWKQFPKDATRWQFNDGE